MQRILFLTDFSENAENAIFYGLSLFKNDPCKFILLNAFHLPYTSHDVAVSTGDIIAENAEAQFKKFLEKARRKFPDEEINIQTEFEIGLVSEVVSRFINRKPVDMIVMGTKGASGIAEALVGSNAVSVIKEVSCPVLVVPAESRYIKPEKFALAVNLKEELKKQTLAPLLKLAEKFNSEIMLLYIISNFKTIDEVENELKMSKLIQAKNTSFHTVHDKDVLNGIEQFVTDQKVSVLAMVTHKLNLFERIFHKSITKRMTLHAEIPLLLMHSKG